MNTQEDILALAEKYQKCECFGIAAFLRFMCELDEAEQAQVFELMLKTMLETHTSVKSPIDFLRILYERQSKNPPFINEGIKLIDLACNAAADIWRTTEYRTQ